MKSKSKHNQKKLRIPNLANNDTEEEVSNLIRPTPKKINEINKSQNNFQKNHLNIIYPYTILSKK